MEIVAIIGVASGVLGLIWMIFSHFHNLKKSGHKSKVKSDNFVTDSIPPNNDKTLKDLTTQIPRTAAYELVGRQDDLDDLRGRLLKDEQVLLVNGLGGIGKTTLAQAYVYKHYKDYRHIAWISQTSKNIIDDFMNTEGLLRNLGINSRGKEPDQLFNEIITELKSMEDRPNLLIIDNADASLAKWRDHLPRQPNWHVLATSREEIDGFKIRSIDFLTEAEAVKLFLKHYKHGEIGEEEIKGIIAAVDNHTLTIEILAKTAQLRRTGINSLKDAIKNDLKAGVHVSHSRDKKTTKIERVTSYLCSVFEVAELNENKKWLMKQFICLPPDFHSYELLEELINPGKTGKEDFFSETMEELTSQGWLLHDENAGYKMHRITAEAAFRSLKIKLDDIIPLAESITDKLPVEYTKDNPLDRFKWVPFGKSILSRFLKDSSAPVTKLQNNLAMVLQDLGDYEGAKDLMEKAVISYEKNLGKDHPTTAGSYSNLALVLNPTT